MCRGTVNGEDVYLIKKELLHSKIPNNPKWVEHHGGIPVDKCIGEEIEHLIKNGVITYGCCCGHGKYQATALVSVDSKDVLEQLGYKLYPYSPMHTEQGIYEIELKSGTQIIR